VDKIKVTFNEDIEVKDHLGKTEQSFSKGKSYPLLQPSADRWIRRGKAVLTSDKASK
jgi:hypothetical protein